MPHVDIVLDITYNIAEPVKSIIRTNAKPEMVEELIVEWLRDQMGRGKDDTPINEKSEYKIKIGLDLTNDNFYTENDTGNKSLTCGLIISLFKCLGRLTISPLSTAAANA